MVRSGSRRSSAGVSVDRLPFLGGRHAVDVLAELGPPGDEDAEAGTSEKDLVGRGEPRPRFGQVEDREMHLGELEGRLHGVPGQRPRQLGLERASERELAPGAVEIATVGLPSRRDREGERASHVPLEPVLLHEGSGLERKLPRAGLVPAGGREQRALREGDDPGGDDADALGLLGRVGQRCVGCVVLAEQQMRRTAQDERRRTPAARGPELPQGELRVGLHLVDAADALRRTHDRQPGLDGCAPVRERLSERGALGERQPPLRSGRPPGEAVRPGLEDGDLGMALEIAGLVEPPEPGLHGLALARGPGRERVPADEARKPVDVPGRVRVGDRRLGLPVLLAPDGGAAAEIRGGARLAPLQLGPEIGPELAVVAVRPAAAVEWDEEKIGLVERLRASALIPRTRGRRRRAARTSRRARTSA